MSLKPLPPGTYTFKVDSVRKRRNKNAYVISGTTEHGHKLKEVLTMDLPSIDYGKVLDEAFEAADAAIKRKFDVGERESPMNCGFAWVTVAGDSGIARYCRNRRKAATPTTSKAELLVHRRYGDKGSQRGWQWWKPGSWPIGAPDRYEQDMSFHHAGAKAFANVLKLYGIDAHASCRLD